MRDSERGLSSSYALMVGLFVALGLALVLIARDHLPISEQLSLRYGTAGTKDFIQYWSAYQALERGLNPYEPAVMAAIQMDAGHDGSQAVLPVMMWNPPWILLVMAPVLMWSFPVSAALWLACNVILFAATIIVCWKAVCRPRDRLFPAALGGAVFFPAWAAISWGQISLLLALAVSVLYWAALRRHDAWIAACVLLLSLKPHLFYLPVLALAWQLMNERRMAVLYWLLFFSAATVGAWLMVRGGVLNQWLESFGRTEAQGTAVTIFDWMSPNLPTVIRAALVSVLGYAPKWPMVVVPMVGAVTLIIALAGKWLVLNWQRHFVPLVALSLLTSPYGWQYDHATLILAPVALLTYSLRANISRSATAYVILALAVIQVVGIAQANSQFSVQYYYWWVPPAILSVWGVALGRLVPRISP